MWLVLYCVWFPKYVYALVSVIINYYWYLCLWSSFLADIDFYWSSLSMSLFSWPDWGWLLLLCIYWRLRANIVLQLSLCKYLLPKIQYSWSDINSQLSPNKMLSSLETQYVFFRYFSENLVKILSMFSELSLHFHNPECEKSRHNCFFSYCTFPLTFQEAKKVLPLSISVVKTILLIYFFFTPM